MHKVGRSIGIAAAAAGAAIATGLGITAKIGWDEFKQGALVAAQTNAVLKSTGGVANVTAKHVDRLGRSVMRYSGIDDEAVKSGENMLLTFRNIHNEVGKGNDIFDQATKVLFDMSTALGTDATKSAIQLGKALNDPIRGITALRRVGVSFTDAQTKMITKLVESGDVMGAQKIILAELNAEFGGSAKAAGKTLPGQINILKETFRNLAGDMVARLLPALSGALDLMRRFLGFMSRIADAKSPNVVLHIVFAGVKVAVAGLYKAIRNALFGGPAKPVKMETARIIGWDKPEGLIEDLRKAISDSVSRVSWSSAGRKIGEAIGGAIKFSAEKLSVILDAISDWIDAHIQQLADLGAKIMIAIFNTLLDPAFWARNWKLALVFAINLASVFTGGFGKIGGEAALKLAVGLEKVFPRIAALFLRLVLFVGKEIGRIPAIIREAFALTAIFSFVSGVQRLVQRIVSYLRGDWRGAVKAALATPFLAAAGPVIGAVNKIISIINHLVSLINHIPHINLKIHIPSVHIPIPGPLPDINIGGGTFGAAGAIVKRPTMALIGERGPEALIPLNRSQGNSPLGGLGDTFNFYGGVWLERDVLSFIENAQRKKQRRGG